MRKICLSVICFFSLLLCINLPLSAQSSKVKIKKTDEGGYYLAVDNKPFLIKGVIYNPTPVCKGYDYDFFSDSTKPWLTDGKLMQEAGINCVRIYSTGEDLGKVKEFINDMYTKFGIYTIVSDWLGLWCYPGVNYADKQFQKNTRERIIKITKTLKNEKGLLAWVLGNENSYTFSGKICFWTCPEVEKIKDLREQIEKRAEIYYSFVDSLAADIKKVDPNHPVALGNGEESFLYIATKFCNNIDILAIISYRGKKFGNLFEHLKGYFDKPIFLSEFGADSYDSYTEKETQETQAEYIVSQWKNLYENSVASGNMQGNCLGGTLFEWTDEWWKHNEGYNPDWCIHNTEAGWSNGSYYFDIKAKNNGLNMSEEWFGIVSLVDTSKTGASNEEIEEDKKINQRAPKKSYYALKEFLTDISKCPTPTKLP